MNKTRVPSKMFISKANMASWFSTCSAPSQTGPFFGLKSLYDYGLSCSSYRWRGEWANPLCKYGASGNLRSARAVKSQDISCFWVKCIYGFCKEGQVSRQTGVQICLWFRGNYGSPSLGWVQRMKIIFKADQTVNFSWWKGRAMHQSWAQNRHYSSPLLVNNDNILEGTSKVVTSNDLVLYI